VIQFSVWEMLKIWQGWSGRRRYWRILKVVSLCLTGVFGENVVLIGTRI